MKALKHQFIEDNNGQKVAAIVPIAEYNKMLELIEELEDIKLYDEAKRGDQTAVPFEQAIAEIEHERNEL